MKRWMIAATMLVALPASAQAMTVAQFLAKANALRAKGPFAIGSPDIKLLRAEVQRVADAYRADLTAARKAGRTPHNCPPPRGKASFGARDVMAEFNAIPPARRGMSVKTAFYAMMKKRFPCR